MIYYFKVSDGHQMFQTKLALGNNKKSYILSNYYELLSYENEIINNIFENKQVGKVKKIGMILRSPLIILKISNEKPKYKFVFRIKTNDTKDVVNIIWFMICFFAKTSIISYHDYHHNTKLLKFIVQPISDVTIVYMTLEFYSFTEESSKLIKKLYSDFKQFRNAKIRLVKV